MAGNSSATLASPRVRWVAAAGMLLVALFAGLSVARETTEEDPTQDVSGQAAIESNGKEIIGATAKVVVTSADVSFNARVDTGAQSTSLHVEEIEIEEGDQDKRKNWGKKVRFKIKNRKGATAWVDSVIDRTVIVKTSEKHDRRYKVPMKLKWKNLEKTVLVTLNDRSGMDYPVLLGRDFLRGDLLVDVELDDENEEVPDEAANGTK